MRIGISTPPSKKSCYIALHLSVRQSDGCPSVVYNLVQSITRVWLTPAFSKFIHTLRVDVPYRFLDHSDKGQGQSDCDKAAVWGGVGGGGMSCFTNRLQFYFFSIVLFINTVLLAYMLNPLFHRYSF